MGSYEFAKEKAKCQLIHSCVKAFIHHPALTHKFNNRQCKYNLDTKGRPPDSKIDSDWV